MGAKCICFLGIGFGLVLLSLLSFHMQRCLIYDWFVAVLQTPNWNNNNKICEGPSNS